MSALASLFPLLVLFTVVAVFAYFGYQIYLWSNEMADRGMKKMEKKNVSFTKDGMRVGVKNMSAEQVADRQQGYFVKAWNYSSMPAYKSMFWNKEEQARQKALAKQGKSSSSSSSSSSGMSPGAISPTSTRNVSAGQHSSSTHARPHASRSGSNPGAFPDA